MPEIPALLVIDMVKDNFDEGRDMPLTGLAKKAVPIINRTSGIFREHGWPVVFATDAYHEDDFIFQSKLPPHSLEGTDGGTVIDELDRTDNDLWLPKPRFSAFFGTTLHEWLHERDVTLCAVAGIATNFCVVTTVMDALCHDFKAVFLEDCATAYSDELHQQTLGLYRRNVLWPLLRVMRAQELVDELI
jgi:nicotinamidase/pyrazinamidase